MLRTPREIADSSIDSRLAIASDPAKQALKCRLRTAHANWYARGGKLGDWEASNNGWYCVNGYVVIPFND